jgi:hypothetical protein
MSVIWGVWIVIKNKKFLVIHETNLLNLINMSLTHIYCSIVLLNHRLIRLNKFICKLY